MAALLQIVGFIWAGIGMLNLFMLDWEMPSAANVNAFAVIFNMVLFVLPGLVLGGMGHNMEKKHKAALQGGSSETIQHRLKKLDDLLAAKAISREEYDARRSNVLKEI